MQTQSIIVYRNPVEQQFWESGMFIPLMFGLSCGLISFVVLMRIAEKVSGWRVSEFVIAAAAVASIFIGWIALNWMMI